MKLITTQIKDANGNIVIYSGTQKEPRKYYECTVLPENADAACKRIEEFEGIEPERLDWCKEKTK